MEKEKFEKEVYSLNDQQKDIVKLINQNLIVLAPAGTGKTKTVALRTANIIMNGILPEKILCLTFTNKACKEMKDRIVSIVGKDAFKIKIKTFHGFCFDVLKSETKRNTDIAVDFLIFDEEDCKEIINEINTKKFNVSMLQFFIEEVKKHSIYFDDSSYQEIVTDYFIKHGAYFYSKLGKEENKAEILNSLKSYGHILLEKYSTILLERHGLDFTDLIIEVYKLFSIDEVLNRWIEKMNYIQIDEVQDTSILEYTIISRLSKGKNIAFFGDINQTIYEWRGSKPYTILENFKSTFAPVVEKYLTINYRSTQKILEASTKYISDCPDYIKNVVRISNVQCISKEEGESIYIHQEENIVREAEWITNEIKDRYMDKLSNTAILTRNNFLNQEISNVLQREGIPCFLVDEFKFFRRKEVKDLLAYLKLALNKYDLNSLKRILLTFVKNIGIKTVDSIENKNMREIGLRLTDFIDINTLKYEDPYFILLDQMEKGNVVIFDVESTGIDTTHDEIIQIAAIKIDSKGSIIKFEEILKSTISVGDSQLVHGFSDDYINTYGKSPEIVLNQFLDFIDDCVIVGHNVSYDLSILRSQLNRLKIRPVKIKGYYDTLDLSRKFYPNLENHKLETLSNFIQTTVSPDHNAMNDVLATKDILMNLIDKIKPNLWLRLNEVHKYKKHFNEFAKQINEINNQIDYIRPYELLNKVIKLSGILDLYKSEQHRIENIKEQRVFFSKFDDLNISSRDSLNRILEFTSLSNSELDRSFTEQNKVPIITVHQSKGLEFDTVFMAGLNENTFPSYMSISSGDISEEYRLFYVAMTRAKKNLYFTWHNMNNWNRYIKSSRFIDYVDKQYKWYK